jgi:hypothetical protein
MMKSMQRLSVAVFALCLAACGTSSSVNPTTGELYTQPSVEVTQNTAVSAETVAGAAVLYAYGPYGHTIKSLPGSTAVDVPNATLALLYIIYDPFAPNWSVQEQRLNEDTYYLSMRAKSFRTGGDGEAIQILKRRALRLQREKGFASYRILDYSEGIESSTPFSHRVSEGTIQLVRAEAVLKKK